MGRPDYSIRMLMKECEERGITLKELAEEMDQKQQQQRTASPSLPDKA